MSGMLIVTLQLDMYGIAPNPATPWHFKLVVWNKIREILSRGIWNYSDKKKKKKKKESERILF